MADAAEMEKKSQDAALQKGISAGKLHVVLHGHKVKGEYALVKTNGKAENAWLLFKVKDKYVSRTDITLQDKSVISNKTLSEVENKTVNDKLITEGVCTAFPSRLAPMLATMVDKPFHKEGWQYEIKWDGYRAVAFCNKNKVALKSRNDTSFKEKFKTVVSALQRWNIHAVLDGEVVVLGEGGKSDFGALQNWRSKEDGEIYFYLFDLLWLNGQDLKQLPLSKRRTILKQLIAENDTIRFSENFEVSGIDFFETAKQMGLEGIMAKKSDSIYSAGNRSNNWLKIKAKKGQEMIIGGYTINADSRKSFSALLLGVYENGKLIYTGKAGTGFTDKQQKEMVNQFKPYVIESSPFKQQPNLNKPTRFRYSTPNATVVWMQPELICEVTYTEMTSDGVMRHPSFVSMRTDKQAVDVTKEEVMSAYEIMPMKSSAKEAPKPLTTKDLKILLDPDEETQLRKIKGHEIKFTNLHKIYWPKEKITKRDMLNYYYQVGPFILPYLKERPQSMNRYPNGIDGDSFYFKDVTDTAPDWIETFDYTSDTDNRLRKYLVAKDEASLLYMATLGCIEMNPWHSKVKTEDYPDWCVIDLDPAENSFNQVIEAANVTKNILDSMGVISYPKTSGSTGIHVYIPMGAKYTYEQSKEFARVIATLVQREIPAFTSIERIVKARKGKMYLDFLQNRSQATIAAPYSLRPKPGATVSMPLRWDEIKKGLKMSDFTIYNALERIKSEGEIFKPVLGKGIDLEKVIKDYTK
jgi:bifunctional non-homologous end joining protein LigD